MVDLSFVLFQSITTCKRQPHGVPFRRPLGFRGLRRAGDAVSHSERLAAFARSRARVAAQNRRAERRPDEHPVWEGVGGGQWLGGVGGGREAKQKEPHAIFWGRKKRPGFFGL